MDCIPDLKPCETGKYHYTQFPKGEVVVSEITQRVYLVGEQTICSLVVMKMLCRGSMCTCSVDFFVSS